MFFTRSYDSIMSTFNRAIDDLAILEGKLEDESNQNAAQVAQCRQKCEKYHVRHQESIAKIAEARRKAIKRINEIAAKGQQKANNRRVKKVTKQNIKAFDARQKQESIEESKAKARRTRERLQDLTA